MKLQILARKLHYWGAILISLPIVLVVATGILLQLKKQVPWVQPVEQRGVGEIPAISFDEILEACRSTPEAEIATWDDINRLDVRPSRGMLKVWAKNNWEIQIDTQTGAVLQVAFRRSDIIEAIHDGSWFSDDVKLWIFLPVAFVLLGLCG
ncbi:MAG: PepSY domain-containing protein [Gemmataceae bacterium]|nr:PepSY domain-containing protein [Gemmataceae bacterium]MCI0738578.1 PepSY domain-containing protein [Gemmataceae bacterium]